MRSKCNRIVATGATLLLLCGGTASLSAQNAAAFSSATALISPNLSDRDDGLGFLSGNAIVPLGPCDVDCPTGASREPGQCSIDGFPSGSDLNGGCNADDPFASFQSLESGDTICGIISTYFQDPMDIGTFRRDTDWYIFEVPGTDPRTVTYTLRSNFLMDSFVISDPNLDCELSDATFPHVDADVSGDCSTVFVEVILDPGTYYLFISIDSVTDTMLPIPCGGGPGGGNDYVLEDFQIEGIGMGTSIARGDCNGDLQFNALVDSLFGLNFGFVPGSPAPPCLAQCDANGDEVFNALVDSLFSLNFGFVPGSPPIPSPHPDCGAESGIDSVGLVGCDRIVCP